MKRMTGKILVTGIIGFLFMLPGKAQDLSDLDVFDRFSAQKVAFFTQRLELNPQEAERFWPLYNEYQKKKSEIIQERRKISNYFMQNQSRMSDTEITDITDKYVALQKKESDLMGDYYLKFKTILPIKKVMRIYQVESMYMVHLLRQLRNRQEAPRNRRF